MVLEILKPFRSIGEHVARAVGTAISNWTRPVSRVPLVGTVTDIARSESQLIAENLFLRQQLIVLNRSVKRPHFTPLDRGIFVLLASKVQSWKDVLVIIKPETVLRWHREV